MSMLSEIREHIEGLVADLEGDDDFMPFLVARRDDKKHFFGLAAMADETKDEISDLLFAAVLVLRAEEAIFASVAWTVTAPREEGIDVPPSEHPDRREEVVLMHSTLDGPALYTAGITREDGKVVMDKWEVNGSTPGARFSDAMQSGMMLATRMPEKFALQCQAAVDAGEMERMLRPAIRARYRIRTGDIPEEDHDEDQA